MSLFQIACLIGLICGVLALALPYAYNPFRLKRKYAGHVSEKANRAIPKIVGVVLLVLSGLPLIAMTLGPLILDSMDGQGDDSSGGWNAAESEAAMVEDMLKVIGGSDQLQLIESNPDQPGRYTTLQVQPGQAAQAKLIGLLEQGIQPRENTGSIAVFFASDRVISFLSADAVVAQLSFRTDDRVYKLNVPGTGVHVHEMPEAEYARLSAWWEQQTDASQ